MMNEDEVLNHSSNKRQKTENPTDDCLNINSIYKDNVQSFSDAFFKKETLKLDNGAEVSNDPFTHCVLPDFVQQENFLNELKSEFEQLGLTRNKSDLFDFEQSKDLQISDLPQICKFKKLMESEVLGWMKKVTKIPFAKKIDISCSCYTHTDYLLCHDDELQGRRIAYIFYLVPEWKEEDGGNLDLFKTVDGQPDAVYKSIVPKWNNFVFFEVSPVSYHQVSEVLSTSKTRLAVSGWFLGPLLKPSVRLKETILFKEALPTGIDVTEWINPLYLCADTQFDIRSTFEDNSEISLPDFLQIQKYEEVCRALNDSKISWLRKGPPNRRNIYEAADLDAVPAILKECHELFNSEGFLIILSNLTALCFHPLCDDDALVGKIASSIRKWCHGSYTLLHNESFDHVPFLHSFMYFNCPGWDSFECGGYVSFVAVEDSEEVLRVDPAPNLLALAYATEGTSHFVKYINSKAAKQILPNFYDICSVYIEAGNDHSE